MSDSVLYKGEGSQTYFGQSRPEILRLIESYDKKILDVGCGSGFLGAEIKQKFTEAHVTGVELSHEAALKAKSNLDNVVEGDVLSSNFNFEENSFDLIIFADVLEHLALPDKALNNFTKFLKEKGRIIVSLPNVRHFSVVIPLVFKGKWEYQDRGIMDKTHLKFFTKSSSIELLENSGFDIKKIDVNMRYIKKIAIFLDKLTFGLLKDFFVQQWIFTARLRK